MDSASDTLGGQGFPRLPSPWTWGRGRQTGRRRAEGPRGHRAFCCTGTCPTALCGQRLPGNFTPHRWPSPGAGTWPSLVTLPVCCQRRGFRGQKGTVTSQQQTSLSVHTACGAGALGGALCSPASCPGLGEWRGWGAGSSLPQGGDRCSGWAPEGGAGLRLAGGKRSGILAQSLQWARAGPRLQHGRATSGFVSG